LEFFGALHLVRPVNAGESNVVLSRPLLTLAREECDPADAERAARSHADCFGNFARDMNERLHQPDPLSAYRRLDWEFDNVRLALLHLELGAALAAAVAMAEFWWQRALQVEAEYWLTRLLPDGAGADQDVVMRALNLRGRARGFNRNGDGAISDFRRALALARRRSDRAYSAIVLTYMGWQEIVMGQPSGTELLSEALRLWKSLGKGAPGWRVAETHAYMGRAELAMGRCERAILHLRSSQREFDRAGRSRYVATVAVVLAAAHLCAGDLDAVKTMTREAIELAQSMDDNYVRAQVAEVGLAVLSPPLDSELNAELVAARDALVGATERGSTVLGLLIPGLTMNARRRAALDYHPDVYARVLNGDRDITGLVLQLVDAVSDEPVPDSGHTVGAITRREVELLQMMAAGLTDVEIEKKLDISGRTLRRFHASVMQKLGATSRSHAVALAARKGLLEESPEPSAGRWSWSVGGRADTAVI
jgi:DNA-binding CsgD family transcriptional regulator